MLDHPTPILTAHERGISISLRTRPFVLGKAKMMKNRFQQISRIPTIAATSTRAARISGTMLMAQETFPMCVEHYLILVSLHLMSTSLKLRMPRTTRTLRTLPGCTHYHLDLSMIFLQS